MRTQFAGMFFFNDTATTEIYTLALHDALPISRDLQRRALEPRHRRQPRRRVRDAPGGGAPHEAAALRETHRDDVRRGLPMRAGDRLGLHGGESRRVAPDALLRARARGLPYHVARNCAGVLDRKSTRLN